MKPWGCHNRAPLRDIRTVQDGWTPSMHSVAHYTMTRQPVVRAIPDPMTKDCQYSLSTPGDPRCTGCRWQQKVEEKS